MTSFADAVAAAVAAAVMTSLFVEFFLSLLPSGSPGLSPFGCGSSELSLRLTDLDPHSDAHIT
jgi:hypothetical protein